MNKDLEAALNETLDHIRKTGKAPPLMILPYENAVGLYMAHRKCSRREAEQALDLLPLEE